MQPKTAEVEQAGTHKHLWSRDLRDYVSNTSLGETAWHIVSREKTVFKEFF